MLFFVSSRRRHTRCALVTGVQTCALPIFVVPRGTAIDVSNLGWPVEPRHGFNNALEALLQQLRIAETINLLQGRHSPKRNRLRWFAPWKLAATLDRKSTRLNSSH